MKLQRERERLIALSLKKQQQLQASVKQLQDQIEKCKRQKEESKKKMEERAKNPGRGAGNGGFSRYTMDKSASYQQDYDFFTSKNYFDDMPTIQDDIMVSDDDQNVDVSEENRRQNGVLFDVNDIEKMMELGKMAL